MIDPAVPSTPSERSRPGRWRRRVAAIGAVLLATAWCGCSVEKHYELLSFFFDGVPDPATLTAEGGTSGPGSAVSFVHQPFRENLCRSCHVTAGQFGLTFTGYSQVEADVCLTCHANPLEGRRVAHGPVAAMACVTCHDPHQSRYEHLLLRPSPELCLYCHDARLLGEPAVAPHDDLARDCLDCHQGHGGDDRYLLRPEPRSEEPADGMPAGEAPADEAVAPDEAAAPNAEAGAASGPRVDEEEP